MYRFVNHDESDTINVTFHEGGANDVSVRDARGVIYIRLNDEGGGIGE